ncbi:MAG TPA: hypothetical protein VFA75_16220 [Nevskia sp.]|nr:hypothetical protein [Nevskia sp.]
MAADHPPADFHLPLRECFPGVWLASSRIAMRVPPGLKITFSRNMVAVLADEGWVLLNPVRLSAEGEAKLLARAPIKHAVRLGTFHGRDDAYYAERFGAQFWSVPGKCSYPELPGSRAIAEGGPLPIADAKAVVYSGGLLAECAVYLPRHRLLVTCDSVQNYDNDPLISPLGRLMMRPLGFFTPCVIGPIWLKQTTPRGGSLRADFERVLALDFDHLIGGHGTPKIGGAREALARNVAKLS